MFEVEKKIKKNKIVTQKVKNAKKNAKTMNFQRVIESRQGMKAAV